MITRAQGLRIAMAKQRLAAGRKRDPAEAAGAVAGVLAVAPTMYLSLLARVDGLTVAAAEDALFEDRRVARIPAMRGVVYALPKDLVPVAFQAARDTLRKQVTRVLLSANLDLDSYEDLKKRILEAVPANTTFTPQTLLLAVEGAASEDVILPAVAAMTAEGVLVRARSKGGWRSNLHEYSRWTDWLPDVKLDSLKPEQARVRLAVAYLRAFGPATARDFAWWAGVGQEAADEAFRKIAERTEPVTMEGLASPFVALKEDLKEIPEPGAAALLPAQDTYLLGYYERTRYADSRTAPYIWDKSGNATSVIVVDGDVVGLWDFESSRRSVSVRYAPLKSVENLEKQIEPAIDRLADFLELKEVRLERVPLPEPIAKAPPGSFEHPLKSAKAG